MPPILLIHAFPLSSAMWAGEARALERFGWVITPDVAGFGQAPRQAKPSVPEMAREIAAGLDRMGVREPVTVGGLSMGGYIAFEFLRQFPQRVRALGLFSTRAAADTPEGRESRFKSAEKIRADGLEPFSRAVLPKLLGKSTLQANPAVAEAVTRMILANKPEGVADALLAMADRRDSTELLGSIRVPALVVAGDEDTFIPLPESEAMAAKIPGARLEVIPKAGHLVNLEQPEKFRKILEGFLG